MVGEGGGHSLLFLQDSWCLFLSFGDNSAFLLNNAKKDDSTKMAATAKPYVGSHVSASGGVEKVFERAAQLGATALQFFCRSQLTWRAPKDVSAAQQQAFAAARQKAGFEMRQVVVHANYLLNLASLDERIGQLTRDTFRDELRRCNVLGVPALVVHPGSNADAAVGRRVVAENVAAALAEVGGDVRVALETMATSGSQLGSIDDLAAIRTLLPRRVADRVGVCLDTCHVFAAGHDLRRDGVAGELVRRICDDAGGLLAVHANDSEKGLGSHADRHANIGHGKIRTGGFWRLLNEPRLLAAHVPIVLETPASDRISTEDEIALLRSLVGAETPAASAASRAKRKTVATKNEREDGDDGDDLTEEEKPKRSKRRK